ncbi:MAG TPA: hypothetical protein VKU01_26885 [Bryobacteraceae bacterium]|nr:hypothetical protein [Bryobacteraceae bacterium]
MHKRNLLRQLWGTQRFEDRGRVEKAFSLPLDFTANVRALAHAHAGSCYAARRRFKKQANCLAAKVSRSSFGAVK